MALLFKPVRTMAALNYRDLVDAPTWEFIRQTEAAYPADTASLSIADQRAIYDRMCRAFFRGYPLGVTSEDRAIGGVPCRVYPGAGPATVVYLHGGGFVVGGLHSHDDVCAEIRSRTGLTVVSVDYRLSPEHQHPAAFQDACSVVSALPGPLVLAGDSAGANLAAAAAHARRDPRILGQVLIYPGLGGDKSRGSYVTHAHAPMLTRDDVVYYSDIRHGGGDVGEDPTAQPLHETDFTGLSPTLAIAAECDPLADDAHDYTARLTAAGVKARAVTETGLVHGYLRARATVPRAAASFDRITAAMTALAQGRFPEEKCPPPSRT